MWRRSLALSACECQQSGQPCPISRAGWRFIFISRVRRGKGDLVIGAELIVLENVFGGQNLISAIGIAVRGVFETIGILSAGPAIIVAHVGAQTSLVHHGNFLGIGIQRHFAVVCIDVSTMAMSVEEVAVCFTVGAYAGADRRTIL